MSRDSINIIGPEAIELTHARVEEAQEHVEAGFEHVCDIDGVKVFRKRK